MRIISGLFKGKKILEPRDILTRPLKDLTKESIFNIINHSNKIKISLEKSYILDLFSGVGSFGLECLSRGSKKVIFVENYSGVLPILKKNLLSLKSVKNYEILENDTNGWTIQLIDGKYPSEKEIANKVKYILNNKQEDKIKKIRARKLLIENFDKNINFEKYVDTIESFNKNAK